MTLPLEEALLVVDKEGGCWWIIAGNEGWIQLPNPLSDQPDALPALQSPGQPRDSSLALEKLLNRLGSGVKPRRW